MQRLGSALMTIAGFVLGLALLARLGWMALHGFEPINEFDRARVADGSYWPIMSFFIGAMLGAAFVVVRLLLIDWRLRRTLKRMDREFYRKYGIPPQDPRRLRRDRP